MFPIRTGPALALSPSHCGPSSGTCKVGMMINVMFNRSYIYTYWI